MVDQFAALVRMLDLPDQELVESLLQRVSDSGPGLSSDAAVALLASAIAHTADVPEALRAKRARAIERRRLADELEAELAHRSADARIVESMSGRALVRAALRPRPSR